MSYWVYLSADPEPDDDPEWLPKTLPVERHAEGGTYVLGGITETELNVTYNYSGHFAFRDLHGKQARETIEHIGMAVQRLGTEQDPDYWASTPGNAGHALSILLAWAEQHPDGWWVVH